MTKFMTATQGWVVDRLKRDWHIVGKTYQSMTHWVLPNGQPTRDACPYPTLKALEKKGIVEWEILAQEWRLVSPIVPPAPDPAPVAAPSADSPQWKVPALGEGKFDAEMRAQAQAQSLAIIEEFKNPRIAPRPIRPIEAVTFGCMYPGCEKMATWAVGSQGFCDEHVPADEPPARPAPQPAPVATPDYAAMSVDELQAACGGILLAEKWKSLHRLIDIRKQQRDLEIAAREVLDDLAEIQADADSLRAAGPGTTSVGTEGGA